MSTPSWSARRCSSSLHKANARAVRAAAVGGDDEAFGVGVFDEADLAPPAADRLDGEGGGVVVNAHAHPTFVGGEVVDAVGNGASEFLDEEIMDANGLEVALGAPLALKRS